uniref:AcidPPc domain-containing protein n=1 Tax=Angiostrongylus cantonensis TaxID=6313 RepID=A0A0K0DH77_ANGCA
MDYHQSGLSHSASFGCIIGHLHCAQVYTGIKDMKMCNEFGGIKCWSPHQLLKIKDQYCFRVFSIFIRLLTDLCVVGVIKLTVQRRRPIYNIDDQVLETPIFDEFSFPSGHSARAAMLATICGAFLSKYRVAVGGIAVLVAVSRVAMGRHYCSDVMGGVALGWLEGMAVLTLPVSFTGWVAKLFR